MSLGSRLLRDRATVIRNPGDRNDFGEWVAGEPVEVEARCTSQPESGRDRVLDPEGARVTARRLFWFLESVDIRLAGAGQSGAGQTTDLIRHGGLLYRVIEIERWKGSHIKVVGSLVDLQPQGVS